MGRRVIGSIAPGVKNMPWTIRLRDFPQGGHFEENFPSILSSQSSDGEIVPGGAGKAPPGEQKTEILRHSPEKGELF